MQAPHTQLPVPSRPDPRWGRFHSGGYWEDRKVDPVRREALSDVRRWQDQRFDAFIRQLDKQLLARTDDLGAMYRRGVVRQLEEGS